MKKEKKGVSPVIATTLLVAMVVVIGLIIFLWFRSFTQEAVTKFGGTNIELVCPDVEFDSDFSPPGDLLLVNIGNVPIYSFKLKVESPGAHTTLNIEDVATWPITGLNQGGRFFGDISSSTSGASKIIIIPVLRGTSDSGEKLYDCDEQYGAEIVL